MVVDGSFGYAGALMVVGVPRGSVWRLTLSDQPVVRTPAPPGSVGVPFGDKPNTLPVSNRAAAFEKAMQPRQLGDSRASAANRA